MTPFLAAIRGGHLNVAQVLLESMMDSQSKLEQSGSSPAAEFSGVKLSAFCGVSCLHLAVFREALVL
ncbi:hypothetical protein BCR33DRAFT_560348 [Rhizoclosmatium globosum]|uniref:Ankyrin n=1 Tax=Rhizoclosmatium globosum TaxID=329046 RepID=A0A1Y2CST2_9FUNG|nr:hypothetical protein BCR33DRAFT_560348 [Rhizoclosmatium globosum]|eukprot:ORY50033.1 hypothetical protein BCR33DRAFT_560348 [Rhizoclosmatium globosum]